MVKFSKVLEAQLIPEWREAFVNYWKLKKQIKKIKLSAKSKNEPEIDADFIWSILEPVRSLAAKISDHYRSSEANLDTIQGKKRKSMNVEEELEEEDGLQEYAEQEYRTELGQLFADEDDVRMFFEKLDEELNKANQFYRSKESEFLARAEILNKQLGILLKLRRVLSNRRRSLSPINSDVSVREKQEEYDDGLDDGKDRRDLVIRRRKVDCAEKMIREAFVELYRGLSLLKSYGSLNTLAFVKILKKFDKVTNQHTSASYLKIVKRSSFTSSDKVEKLMDEVESTFTKHFENDDRKRAMKFLRPHGHLPGSHVITFFLGLFTGCFASLFIVYAILAHLSGIFNMTKTGRSYVETVYPVFSVFALLSLHIFMYGCNLFMWKNARINYNFIFEFQPRTALKHRDAFLISTTFMTCMTGAMVLHLILQSSSFSPCYVDSIPRILLLICVGWLILPFNILYRQTRYSFIRIIRNIICTPFYKVLMVDFFMADQLTSQIPLLRHMETTACYLLAGTLKTHQHETCSSGKLYQDLAYIISFLPYYWRAMQCARRWFDECDNNHLGNMGKYVSAMVAAGARITYSRQENQLWLSVVLATSLFATVYQLYWDFVKDWGLLNPMSKNIWLRDELILKNKSIYYFSIALNILLRVAWIEMIMGFHSTMVESRMLEFFLASLEIIRRGHWNFYRFRAVKAVQLPFRSEVEHRL